MCEINVLSHRCSVPMGRVNVSLNVEVTWEDQQKGMNGSLSDGGAQPAPSLDDAGWSFGVDFCFFTIFSLKILLL